MNTNIPKDNLRNEGTHAQPLSPLCMMFGRHKPPEVKKNDNTAKDNPQ